MTDETQYADAAIFVLGLEIIDSQMMTKRKGFTVK